jgi:hypothetical protein
VAVVLVVQASSAYLRNCSFVENWQSLNGGAIRAWSSAVTVISSWFYGNAAGGEGGAIHSTGSSGEGLMIVNSTFESNSAVSGGGAVTSSSGEVTVLESNFTDNWSRGWGGALLCEGSELTANYSLFVNNSASWYGGAIAALGSSGVKLLDNEYELNKGYATSNDVYVSGGTFWCLQEYERTEPSVIGGTCTVVATSSPTSVPTAMPSEVM